MENTTLELAQTWTFHRPSLNRTNKTIFARSKSFNLLPNKKKTYDMENTSRMYNTATQVSNHRTLTAT